jgi:putative membrane protein
MNKDKGIIATFIIFLKGFCMGLADVIPGVSGGTIAFITGIYARLIHSLSTIDLSFIFLFVQGKWKKSWNIFKRIDFSLFIPLGLGIILAVFFFSKVIEYFLQNQPVVTFSFFFGLILASAVIFLRKIGKMRFEKAVFLALGFVFAYVLAGLSSLSFGHSLPMIFIAGAVAICAMILPGISGAFILLLLNQYEFLISILHSYNLPYLFTFFAGALVGLFSFSKIIDYLLRHYKAVMLSFLVGLMVGSLRIPYVQISSAGNGGIFAVLIGMFGFFLVLLLESFGKRSSKKSK